MDVGSGSHAEQTGTIMTGVEKLFHSVGFAMKMTTQTAYACRFSFFGHETGYHEHLLDY
jgi:hypothetical protein